MFDLYNVDSEPQNVLKAEVRPGEYEPFVWEIFAEGEADDDEFQEGLPGLEGLDPAEALAAARKGTGYGIEQIVNEAEAILKDAQEEADRILAQAHQRALAEKERVYHEALDAARSEVAERDDPAQRQAMEELQSAADELRVGAAVLNRLHEQLEEAFAQRVASFEANLLDMAFEIARRVVGRELETQPELVLEHVREALGRLASGEVTVRLNPADLPIVQQALLELQAERNVGDLLAFEADARVERGGCVATGENGTVDTQPATKLQVLRAAAEG